MTPHAGKRTPKRHANRAGLPRSEGQGLPVSETVARELLFGETASASEAATTRHSLC